MSKEVAPMTLEQLHEAAKAFRVQFRPLIDVLDQVALIVDLSNSKREVEAKVKELTELAEAKRDALATMERECKKAEDRLKDTVRETTQRAQIYKAAQVEFASEQKRRVGELEALLARRKDEQDRELESARAAAQFTLDNLKEKTLAEETKLTSLRKAIAGIVNGEGGG